MFSTAFAVETAWEALKAGIDPNPRGEREARGGPFVGARRAWI
jgi:hypothetical protein